MHSHSVLTYEICSHQLRDKPIYGIIPGGAASAPGAEVAREATYAISPPVVQNIRKQMDVGIPSRNYWSLNLLREPPAARTELSQCFRDDLQLLPVCGWS